MQSGLYRVLTTEACALANERALRSLGVGMFFRVLGSQVSTRLAFVDPPSAFLAESEDFALALGVFPGCPGRSRRCESDSQRLS